MKRHTVKAAAGMFLLIGFLFFGIVLDKGWTMDGKRGRGGPMPPPPEAVEACKDISDPPIWRYLSLPGLDEKQKEAIKKIKNMEAKDNIKKMADVRIAGIELRDILDKDPVDMNAVEAKLKKISSLMTDIRLSEIKAVEEIKTKLTPEQRKSFKEMLEMGYGMGGIMREGMKMPPPPHMNP